MYWILFRSPFESLTNKGWHVWIAFFFQGVKRNGKSHANNSKKIMQQKHVSLYAFSYSLGEYDRPPKSIRTSKSLKKTL